MILVACGLKREAAIIERYWTGADAVPGGGDGVRLERLLEAGAGTASTLFSIGIAGALDPALLPGDVIACGDATLLDGALAACPDLIAGAIIGSDRILATPSAKADLRAATAAAAVDMETHVAHRVAVRHGLPFLAIRAISDTAHEALPPAALVGMAPDGGLALASVLFSLARHPGQLPALLRLGRSTTLALGNLANVLKTLDIMIGFGSRIPRAPDRSP